MFIDIVEQDNELTIWERGDDGVLNIKRDAVPYNCYVKHPCGNLNTIFGDKVKRVDFDNFFNFREFINDNKGLVYESDIKPIYKYLSTNYYGKTGNANVAFYDIETYVKLYLGEGFPRPENPYGEVNALSLIKMWNKQVHQLCLIDPEFHDQQTYDIVLEESMVKNGYILNVHFFDNEKDLLDTFYNLIDDVDILSGWGSEKYDDPYMNIRSEMIYGEFHGCRKYSRHGFETKQSEAKDAFDNTYTRYTPQGRVCLDYMDLYKRFSFGDRESYSLDFISNTELKRSKIPYEGDLGDLYRNDPKKFFQYSLNDTVLLAMLDEKLKIFDTVKTMVWSSGIKFNDILGSIRYIENSIINFCHYELDEKLIVPDLDREAEKEKFIGAFVLTPQVGAHKKTSSIDLASLYPSIMRSINISPETLIIQCMDGHDDFVKVVEESEEMIVVNFVDNDDYTEISGKELSEYIKIEKLTISSNGSIFVNVEGIIPKILTKWYTERKSMKAKSKKAYNNGDIELGDYYDLHQQLRKLNLNSTYGAVSNRFCRFYNLDCAKSVTMTGQYINKWQCYKANVIIDDLKTEMGEKNDN